MADANSSEKPTTRQSKDDFALAIWHFSLAAVAFGLLLAFFILHGKQLLSFLASI